MRFLQSTAVHFLLFIVLLHSSSRAQMVYEDETNTFEAIAPNTSLRLLGRGIVDKETKAALVLACSNDSCTKVRWVLHTIDNQTHWLGADLGEKQTQDLKAYLDRIHQYSRKETNSPFFGFAVFIAGGVLLVTGVAAAVVPLYYGGAALMAASALPAASNSLRSPKILVTSNDIAKVTDQNNWNWFTSPQKSRHSYFASVFRQIARAALIECIRKPDQDSEKNSDPLLSARERFPYKEIIETVKDLNSFPKMKNESWVWNSNSFRIAE